MLVAACGLLKEQGHDFECWIIGEGHLHKQLERQIRTLRLEQQVQLLGKRAHHLLNIFYNQADVFVLPCQRLRNGDMDGIPNVLIEAMACGKPVISTAISGIPELIEHEKTGLLVPAGAVNELAQAIIRLMQNKNFASTLGAAARKKVVRDFNINKVAQQIIHANLLYML